MDFLTEILVSFMIGVIVFFGLLRANVSKDKAQLGAVFLGGWIFAQLPKYTRTASSEYELKLINGYSTTRSYFVGLIVAAYIVGNYVNV
jgi:fructose-specific phosphotransferase system IIC component